jgi:hypothetical protein
VSEPVILEMLQTTPQSGLEMRLSHSAIAYIADEMAAVFAESGATNYLEFTMTSERYGAMTVSIKRRNGKTVSEVNQELKAELDEAIGIIRDVSESAGTDCFDCDANYGIDCNEHHEECRIGMFLAKHKDRVQ